MLNSRSSLDKNPSVRLYNAHKEKIISVRETLFSSLEKDCPRIGKAARSILQNKTNECSNGTPRMFELFPWIIKDLSGLNSKKVHDISVGWLAIYLYITFLDDHLDNKTEIKADEFLGASVLAQKGLLNLFKIVNGTKFEKLFNTSLSSAAHFQLVDVLNQAEINDDPFKKSKSASGKNKILIACAGALAASKEKDATFIIEFTKSILLTAQFLDDLADLETDFRRNNITVLLNEVAKKNSLNPNPVKRIQLIEELISTGSLLNIINKVESSLLSSIMLIEKNKIIRDKKTNPTYSFFTNLYLEILILQNQLQECKNSFIDFPTTTKKKIIKDVEDSIVKIYLHT